MDIRTGIIIALTLLLFMAFAISGYFYWELENQPKPIPIPETIQTPQPPAPNISDTSERIDLFYLTPDQSQFVKESRLALRSSTIPDRIRKSIEALLSTSKTPSNLIAPIPEGTQLQSVFWSEFDGRVYISFSKELIANSPGHALSEWATIYCIVNTAAAQSATVKEVQILVDGETIQSLNTNWDWSRPFQPDPLFVQYTTSLNKPQ